MTDDKVEIVAPAENPADEKTENIGGEDEKGDNEGDNKSTAGTLNTMDPAV